MVATQEIITGNFAPLRWVLWPPSSLGIVDWNIDRGQQLQGVIEFLASANADILILQEADLDARRTHRLNIAEEIARKLQMNYVFGREFSGTCPGIQNVSRIPWPGNSVKMAHLQPAPDPLLSAIALLGAALVSSADRALPGETGR